MHRKRTFKASGRNDLWFSGVCIAALLVIGVVGSARAQEATGPQISWNGAVTSDYVFRGVSQTMEDPAISAGVDLTHNGFYAGAWASNVDFGDGETDAEVDLYAGYRPEVSGFNLDFGVIGYLYTSQPNGADYDYVEFKAAASRAVGPATVGAAVFYSPDFFGASEDEATYLEVNGAWSPADKWTLSGAVGRQWVSSDFDYNTWNVGAAYQLTDNLAVDVRYHDTDENDFGDNYGSRAVATLKAAF
ncbi:TorF family putative porin [Brevundimonas sp. GCM10030266]|uniref:TorF family putative porin n=1 Tax=Brevundimonas sp. GCM10030266 TaxID=3273386 RepID=UPI0036216A48